MTKNVLSNTEANAIFPVIHEEKFEIIKVESDGSFTINKTPTILQKCEICDTPTLLRCNGCRRMAYCCKEHQKLDWKRHKDSECKCYKINHHKYIDCKKNAFRQLKNINGPPGAIPETMSLCFNYTFNEDSDKEDLPYDVKNGTYKSKLKIIPQNNNMT